MPGPAEPTRPRRRLPIAPIAPCVGLQVALRVPRRPRRLAQHVEGVAVALAVCLLGAVQRLLDGAAHDELAPHDAHGLAHRLPDHRLAGPRREPAQRAAEVAAGVVRLHQTAGQHQRPGRGVDEQRAAVADMLFPVGVEQLVRDQQVGGLRRRECAAAPRRGTSAPRPRGWTGRIHGRTRPARPRPAPAGGLRRPGALPSPAPAGPPRQATRPAGAAPRLVPSRQPATRHRSPVATGWLRGQDRKRPEALFP